MAVEAGRAPRSASRRSPRRLTWLTAVRPYPAKRLWVCDLKYVQTAQGFLFLAAVQDVYSRRIVGWSMRTTSKPTWYWTPWAWPSLLAAKQPGSGRPQGPRQPVHQPSLRPLRQAVPIELSMGSVGDPWDNAMAETFFASLEKELLRRERFETREQARMRISGTSNALQHPKAPQRPGRHHPQAYEQRYTNKPMRPNHQVSTEAGQLQRAGGNRPIFSKY